MNDREERTLSRAPSSAVMSPIDRLRRLAARPSRIVDRLREPRGLVVGGPIVNRLGLQVARTTIDHVLWLARRSDVTPEIRELYDVIARDGIVVVPNFLSSADFDALMAEHERSRERERSRYQPVRFGDNLVSDQLTITDFAEDYPEHCRSLRDHPTILALASAVSRRPMSFKPHLRAEVIYKPNPSEPAFDHNEAQFLHTDRHFPFVKGFFYLCDVDETNAPYTFVKGSHRIDGARLRYEYELSLRVSRQRRELEQLDRVPEQAEIHRQVYTVARELMRERNLVETPITGRANTLIVSNNQGLHRRGEFRGSRPRAMVNLDFKYLESTAHTLYPMLRLLPKQLVGE